MDPFDPKLKERFFAAAEESPGSWLISAMSLRAAAARLDWLAAPARDDESSVSFIREYRMLLGLSFENILKGIISLVRIEAGQRPPLPRECLHHSLATLAARPEVVIVSLSPQEVALLNNMTPFIEWSGKYPLPKRHESYAVSGHSNHEHDAELLLWERLAAFLADRSWVMKGGPERMGGIKLYTKKGGDSDA
ncbi:MAG: hypothetical protein KBE19_12420 [Rhodocyclaceae bacterium]|nr:hypothetical protein [Rhodocyclaceae bacterium]